MHRRRQWLRNAGALGAGGLVAGGLTGVSRLARAAVFLDETQVRSVLWPQADGFAMQPLDLSAPALSALATQCETRIPQGYAPRCWLASRGKLALGWVLSDRVLGKYDMIDYAAGFGADGKVTGLEIMAYRESHGTEVRNAAWRRQFVAKHGPQQLRFGEDIRNISGATLSCQHVTEGVRRLSVLVAALPPLQAGGGNPT